MPAIKTLSVTDGTDTRVLTPDSNSSSGFRSSTEDKGLKAANLSTLISIKSSGKSNSHYVRMAYPILRTDTDSGEDYVVDNNYVNFTLQSSPLSTSAEKEQLLKFFLSLAEDADLVSAIANGKSFY